MESIVSQVDGLKALILDDDTKNAVSSATSLSDIFERDVFLISSLGQKNESDDLTYLKAIVFVRVRNRRP